MAAGRHFLIRLAVGLTCLAFSWIFFTRFLVPTLITSAYRRQSLPFINAIISGQDLWPLEHYLADWQTISSRLVGFVVLSGLVLIPSLAAQVHAQLYDRTKLFRVYLVVTLVNVLFLTSIYIFVPALRPELSSEDHLVENLTAVLYFTSFVLGSLRLTKVKGGHERLVFCTVSLLGIVGFLDELSFGERLFRLEMPVLHGVQIDAIHDFFTLGYHLYGKTLLYGFSLTLIVFGLFLFSRHREISARYPRLRYIAFIVSFGSIALVIDLHIIETDFLQYVEELFEMNAALALAFCTLATRTDFRYGSPKTASDILYENLANDGKAVPVRLRDHVTPLSCSGGRRSPTGGSNALKRQEPEISDL